MSTPTISNRFTDATAKNGNQFVSVLSDGTAAGTTIVTSTGRNLGLVQSAKWELSVEGEARLTIETLFSPAELKTTLKDTILLVRPAPQYHPFRYLYDWYATKVAAFFGLTHAQ